jgi:hypothetical protein
MNLRHEVLYHIQLNQDNFHGQDFMNTLMNFGALEEHAQLLQENSVPWSCNSCVDMGNYTNEPESMSLNFMFSRISWSVT